MEKQTYQVNIVSTRNYSVDLERIYNVVVEEEGTDSQNYIPDAFGDNVEYYLEKIYGFKFEDVEETSMNAFIEKIADDFYYYVENRKQK